MHAAEALVRAPQARCSQSSRAQAMTRITLRDCRWLFAAAAAWTLVEGRLAAADPQAPPAAAAKPDAAKPDAAQPGACAARRELPKS